MKKGITIGLIFLIISNMPNLLSAQVVIGTGGLEVQACCSGVFPMHNSLEEALQAPEDVTKLNLAMQSPKLTSIPAEVSKLKNLKCLIVSFNRISNVPEEIAQLDSLECIDISGNRYLAEMPEVFAKLKNLQKVIAKDIPEWSTATRDKARELLPNVELILDK